MTRWTLFLFLAATVAACQQTMTVQHPCTGELVKGKVVGENQYNNHTFPRVELPDGRHVTAFPDQAGPLGWKCPEGLAHIGVRECDDYIAKFSDCLSKMAPDAQEAIKPAFKHTQDTWKHVAETAAGRASLVKECANARAAIRATCH